MRESPAHHETNQNIREFSFDEGVAEILSRVSAILSDKNNVTIAINGRSHDVGKTFLCRTLTQKLVDTGIAVATVTQSSAITKNLHFFGYATGKRRALVLDAQPFINNRSAENDEMAKRSKEAGLPFDKIDIIVLLHRPDKRFFPKEMVLGDVIINNERAADDKRKLRSPPTP